MNTMKDMMEKVGNNANAYYEKPTKEQLEANIKISHNWATAVAAGTFQGAHALHVATLLDFLQKQNQDATRAYEAESLTHPEWGVKVNA